MHFIKLLRKPHVTNFMPVVSIAPPFLSHSACHLLPLGGLGLRLSITGWFLKLETFPHSINSYYGALIRGWEGVGMILWLIIRSTYLIFTPASGTEPLMLWNFLTQSHFDKSDIIVTLDPKGKDISIFSFIGFHWPPYTNLPTKSVLVPIPTWCGRFPRQTISFSSWVSYNLNSTVLLTYQQQIRGPSDLLHLKMPGESTCYHLPFWLTGYKLEVPTTLSLGLIKL